MARGLATSAQIVVNADTPAALDAALTHVSAFLDAEPGAEATVRVVYVEGLRNGLATARHLAFARRHLGSVSTFVPVCVPGSPPHAQLARFASPPNCHDCVLYQGRACQGFGFEAQPFEGLTASPALLPLDRPASTFGDEDFRAQTPVCYWRPEAEVVAQIAMWIRAAGGSVWDVGGANGYLSGLLAQAFGLTATIVDPLSCYPTPEGTSRLVADVRTLFPPPPDALLISWPPTGDGFRDVVKRLRPAVVIYARDQAGHCGRTPGHRRVRARASGLEIEAFDVDDFARMAGYRRVYLREVQCRRDGPEERSGLLEIRATAEARERYRTLGASKPASPPDKAEGPAQE